MLDKREHIIMLKDFYGSLLTDKQQYVLELYFENDLSLSEIAENMGISKQAVHDLLKRSENLLKDYEERLQLVKRFLVTRKKIEEVCEILNEEISDNCPRVNEALDILRGIVDSL
ncbi:YlxM family DNA-binding protein [Thermosyntropha sp.]|uniref:YlxM family DNA-binding protein n=1 Tax=Thermosyntropha sp. TaxID=2740820 RepID=UPI0025CF0614|nr:putative DNA-binding protein [Thermosyntropha sp.]MBO8158654.1 putative DNA-binding protein [Thermosyntropha sp.]